MKVVSREFDERITRWYNNAYIGIIIIIIIIIIITACYKVFWPSAKSKNRPPWGS